MDNYLVVADDFTGANDTGLEIRRRGIPVRVVFAGADVTGGESCVLDTESRPLPEEEAFKRVLSEAGKIPFGNFRHVIKKVDSTLRGNIGAETRALSLCCKPELIVFAPAFPDLGRTTVRRIHHINGTPVSLSELARDPKTPVINDDILKIMAAAFPGEKVIHIDPGQDRGAIDLDAARVFSFDAIINEDLRAVAKTVLAQKKRVLWVGSAALANFILEAELPSPPALAVAASLSSVTRAQVLFAERQGVPLVRAPLYAILEKAVSPEELADRAVRVLKDGRDLILLSSSVYSEEERTRTGESARAVGLSPGEMGAFAQKTMGRITALVLEEAAVSGLFLTGGDTALGCLESMGATGSGIVTEAAAGMPLMKLTGGKYDGLKVVTKAGAFGGEDAIFYSLRKLREA